MSDPTLLLRLLQGAGRFRPTSSLARSVLRKLRARNAAPRWATGRIAGNTILLDLDEMVDQKIFLFGAFDERGVGLIRQVMRRIDCRTFLDIGANIGNHVALLERYARRTCAFEPNPSVFARLRRLVEDNGLARVSLFAVGLSDQNGELPFYVYPQAAHVGSFERRPGAQLSGSAPIRIGDDVLEQENIRDIDLIKIDVEGHEFEALKGLRRTIDRDRPFVVMEYEGRTVEMLGRSGLDPVLPDYVAFGTRRTFASRLLKAPLALAPIDPGRAYSQILCAPKEKLGLLGDLGA